MMEAEVGVIQQKARQGPPWIAGQFQRGSGKPGTSRFQRDHDPDYILIWGFQALDVYYNTFLLL